MANKHSNDPFEGNVDAARERFTRLAQMAVLELSARQLNTLSFLTASRIANERGAPREAVMMELLRDLRSEQENDWTIRFDDSRWGHG